MSVELDDSMQKGRGFFVCGDCGELIGEIYMPDGYFNARHVRSVYWAHLWHQCRRKLKNGNRRTS